MSPPVRRDLRGHRAALNPVEHLLEASLLIALYMVRSERQVCEKLRSNLLFKWSFDLDSLSRA